MLAQKVKTREEFEWALDAAYDYFQGYFFASGDRARAAHTGGEINLFASVRRSSADRSGIRATTDAHLSRCVALLQPPALCELGAFFIRDRNPLDPPCHGGAEGNRHWPVPAALPAMAKYKPGEMALCPWCARVSASTMPAPPMAPPNLAFLMGLFSCRRAHRPPHSRDEQTAPSSGKGE